MSSKISSRQTKRKRPGYFFSILIIALVLTVLGLFGAILIYAKNLSKNLKEKIQVEVELRQNTKESDALLLQKKIEAEKFTKSAIYISKEEVVDKIVKDIDPDYMKYLPTKDEQMRFISPSVNFYVMEQYSNNDSLGKIKETLMKEPGVTDVSYKSDLVENINRNSRYITIIIAVLGLVLFFISLALIDSTIRLIMFSNRFVIRSMQLVGATRRFIIRPYMTRAIYNGVLSGILAGIFLAALVYILQQWIPDLQQLQDFLKFGVLLVSIIIFGILISWISTYFAVLKYLKMKLDDLY